MAKRFTDTDQWERPWFRGLSLPHKLLWRYILDRCDIAGIWYVDLELASFLIATSFNREEAEKAFEKQIEVKGDRWLIKDFISFQYGTIKPENKLFASVMRKLEQFKEGASMPHLCPINGAKDKDKDKDKEGSVSFGKHENLFFVDKKQREEHESAGFSDFWQAYPKRRSKGDALKAWRKLNPTKEQVSRILAAINRAKRSSDWAKDGGQFIPYPATWINAQGWEDDMTEAGNGNNGPSSLHDRLLEREPHPNGKRNLENVPSVQGGLVFPEGLPVLK